MKMHLKKGKKTMNLVEVNGKTVEEAIARALKKLGLPKKDVEVEIVSSGKAGFLGLGSEDAVVRVTAKKGTNPRNPNKKNYTQPVKKSYSNTWTKLT
jgi:spoIIIJ-associated protein